MTSSEFFAIQKKLEAIHLAVASPPRLAFSLKEVCAALHISQPVARLWIKNGRLRATRTSGTSGSWVISISAIQDSLNFTEEK